MLEALIQSGSAYWVDLALSFVVLLVVSYVARLVSHRQRYSKFPLHIDKSNPKQMLLSGFAKVRCGKNYTFSLILFDAFVVFFIVPWVAS